jgi:hypothetical protein
MKSEELKDNLAILVKDRTSPKYGNIGRIIYSELEKNEKIKIIFSDGKIEEFEGTQYPEKIQGFYRHFDAIGETFDKKKAGPKSLQVAFLEYGGNLNSLEEQYRNLFEEELPK